MVRACVLAPLALAALTSSFARADPAGAQPVDPPLHWDDQRPRFRPVEYALTAVVGNLAVDFYFWLPAQSQPHWVGGILFDGAVRNALRLHSYSAQVAAFAWSDIVNVSDVLFVVGVDSLAVPLLRGSPDVAWQLELMNLESFATGSLVTFSLYDSVGRARPSYLGCQRNANSAPDCPISPTASFPSGHTAEVFLSAGVSCAHHAYVHLYKSGFWDAFACARDLTLAALDGTLRVMGDRHWATDVLTGAAIGFGFGYGLPTLLHYRAHARSAATSWTLSPLVGRQTGLALLGAF